MQVRRMTAQPALRGIVRSFEERRVSLGSKTMSWPLTARPHQIIDIYLAEPFRHVAVNRRRAFRFGQWEHAVLKRRLCQLIYENLCDHDSICILPQRSSRLQVVPFVGWRTGFCIVNPQMVEELLELLAFIKALRPGGTPPRNEESVAPQSDPKANEPKPFKNK